MKSAVRHLVTSDSVLTADQLITIYQKRWKVKAGLPDLASALAKIEGSDNPKKTAETYLRLQEFHTYWPKLMEGENRVDFSDSEEAAMTMVTFGMLLSLSTWNAEIVPFGERFDEAMERCTDL